MIAAGVVAASVQPAAASTPVSGLSWVVRMDNRLNGRLPPNCIGVSPLGWTGGGVDHGMQLFGTFPSFDTANGSYDPAAGGGAIAGSGDALIFDALFSSQGGGGHPFKLSAMGIERAGGRVFVTGQIHPTRTRASAARRQRIALIAHPRFLSGAAHGGKGKPDVANSFLFAIQGEATITKQLSRALSRARCTSHRFAGQGNGPIRAGTPLGLVTVQLLAGAATGLAGTAEVSQGPVFFNRQDDSPITITPTGGATFVTRQRETSLRFQLPAGTRTPLACVYGYKCEPASGGFSLPGGFVMSYNARSATVGDLAVTYSPTTTPFAPTTVVTGTLDGRPVTIATDSGLSDDFLSQVEAALGVELVGGDPLEIDAQFTATGPR